MSPLQAEEIFLCLDRNGVRYVVIGGLAAVLHGAPLLTLDVDICPSRDEENLERLARSLEEMQARIRTGDPDGVRFPFEAAFLRNVELLNLRTRFGDLDLSFIPAGTGGFADLVRNAVPMTIRGIAVGVASLEDVIRSKAAANRPKDQRTLPVLRQLLEEIEKRRNEG
jgi:predicted nucleotidyltransferase